MIGFQTEHDIVKDTRHHTFVAGLLADMSQLILGNESITIFIAQVEHLQ